jgi:hypothetical protein
VADAWGGSWGTGWGVSWGTGVTRQQPDPGTAGRSSERRAYRRKQQIKRNLDLLAQWDRLAREPEAVVSRKVTRPVAQAALRSAEEVWADLFGGRQQPLPEFVAPVYVSIPRDDSASREAMIAAVAAKLIRDALARDEDDIELLLLTAH